jgi:hypothetical protein
MLWELWVLHDFGMQIIHQVTDFTVMPYTIWSMEKGGFKRSALLQYVLCDQVGYDAI